MLRLDAKKAANACGSIREAFPLFFYFSESWWEVGTPHEYAILEVSSGRMVCLGSSLGMMVAIRRLFVRVM
jgi:hypothetical protein